MKILLILYMCSYTAGSCLPGHQWPDKFNDMYDCMMMGYSTSIDKMVEIGRAEVNEYDIFILPPWVKISKIKFNIFINVRSFMEMNKNIIKRYFDLIQENITEEGLFLNINRYDKRSVGEPIRLFEYPYDDKWKVIMYGNTGEVFFEHPVKT